MREGGRMKEREGSVTITMTGDSDDNDGVSKYSEYSEHSISEYR